MAVLRHLWLRDFRNIVEANVGLEPGRVVVKGNNGQGKSNLIEAISYLGSLSSFRGAPPEALIHVNADEAVIRAEVVSADRELLIEVSLVRGRPNRIQVNKQKLGRARELLGMLPVTVFGPDDLGLVKGGPGVRRGYIDDLLVQLHPRNAQLRSELDKILKQRNALLRSAHGRKTAEVESTMVVWNTKLDAAGDVWGRARRDLVTRLGPRVHLAYEALAGVGHPVTLTYDPGWLERGLLVELEAIAADELRRGTTLVGPHRDEMDIRLGDMPARTHASQGEQRTMSLALRIAGHHELREVLGTSPLLLLDDVFSELDHARASALLSLLEADQTIVTTATDSPLVDGPIQQVVLAAGVISVP